jgi:hypothetical protein
MEKHKQLRERFGNVLPTDNAVEVLEAIEQWLIERENQALRIHDVVGRSEQLPCPHCGQLEPCAGNSPETCYHPKVC